MAALANLLPGVRELRSPLVAGYLWLLFAWLRWDEAVPTRGHAQGTWHELYSAADTVGAIGIVIAASFLAYLVGSLSIGLWSFFVTPIERLVFKGLGPYGSQHSYMRTVDGKEISVKFDPTRRLQVPESELSQRGYQALVGAIEDQLRNLDTVATDRFEQIMHDEMDRLELSRRFFLAEPFEPLREKLKSQLGYSDERIRRTEANLIRRIVLPRLLFDDLNQVKTRLIGSETDLYAAVDRLRAEAEVRAAVIAPFIVLVVFPGRHLTGWLLFAILPTVALWLQGVLRRRASDDLLADAIQLRRVQAPTLERIEREAASTSIAGA